ncbi:MAG: TlpA family protein disulfide reductase [Proteobacteria bacterium]|nr:TlpA family protein disulfide reductase [Pseudomonadota bacterium]
MTYKAKGVVFLGAFAGSKEKDIGTFAEKYQLTYPVGQETGIAKALGAKGIPETIVINQEGTIIKRYTKPINFDELKDAIDALLQ